MTKDAEEASRISSQLKLVIRPMYSSPPLHGARIVTRILNDEALRTLWRKECAAMATRIRSMREALQRELEKGESQKGLWEHVTRQIGMFCFTGLSARQVEGLRNDFHIYCTSDGRISMAGLNSSNVSYVATSVLAVRSKYPDTAP